MLYLSIKKIKKKDKKQPKTKRRGRPSKKATAQNITYTPSLIDFSAITKLNNLNVDPK